MKKIERITIVSHPHFTSEYLDREIKLNEIIDTVNELGSLLESIRLYGESPSILREKLLYAVNHGWKQEPKTECAHLYGYDRDGFNDWLLEEPSRLSRAQGIKFQFCPLCGERLI